MSDEAQKLLNAVDYTATVAEYTTTSTWGDVDVPWKREYTKPSLCFTTGVFDVSLGEVDDARLG